MKTLISLHLCLLTFAMAPPLWGQAEGQAVAGAETAPSNIRFQFDGMPYMEVLQRFAQMVNKPLISDTNIEGTLTFTDAKPYAYPEAMDTLNLILSMKDVTLIESGRYLRLVPLQKLAQMPLRVLHGLDQVGDARPDEVLTVVLDLKNLDAGEVAPSLTNMLSKAGSIASLSRGRGLIITDRLANIQRIRRLISEVDTESSVERQMKTFTLLHASGAVLADLINRTFGVSTAPKRTQLNPQTKAFDVLPPDPNDYVTAVFDDASRTLVLFGPRERISLAEEMIGRFEEKDGARGGEVRIFYPRALKADELARMVREAVPGVAAAGETAATAATKARLITDPASNRLIVTAPIAGQLDSIEQVIQKIDGSSSGAGGTRSETIQITRVFRPRTGDAAALAKVIMEATARRTFSGGTEPTVNATVDTGSQSVVVSGSPGSVQQVEDLLSQLESGLGSAANRQTRFIDVGGAAQARRLAPLVEQIYKSEVAETLPTAERATLLTDPESGRLIVTGPAEHLARIEEIVNRLRSGAQAVVERRLRILPLNNLKAEAALPRLNELIKDRMRERVFVDQPEPNVLADGPQNRLLVTCTDAQWEAIQEVARVLDTAPDRARREMTMLPLQSKTAADLIPLLSQLLSQPETAQTLSSSLPPKLIPDPSGRQLIVLAAPGDLDRIRELVAKLDAGPGPQARQFRPVELFDRKAADLLPLVRQLYEEQRKGMPEPAGGTASLLAEDKTNQIMVSGPQDEIARVEAIVRQLDPAGRGAAREETRVVRLRNATAADLVTLVETSLNSRRQQVKVLLDARSNSLVVTGSPQAVEAAGQVIEQLDGNPDRRPTEVRVLDLRSADAATVAPLVTELHKEWVHDKRGAAYTSPTKIIADTAANRLIVTGPAEELDQVAGLVEQFDRAPKTGTGTRVFPLRQAEATALASIVTSAMVTYDTRNQPIQRVSVAADPKSNSLVVSGSRADLEDAALVIDRLDGQGAPATRTFRMVDVAQGSATQMVELATRVFAAQNQGRPSTEELVVTADPSGNRVILVGPESRLNQAEAMLASLNQRREPENRNLEVLELKRPNAETLVQTVSRIYTEQAGDKFTRPPTLFADASGRRLTVISSPDQLAMIKKIVASLEAGDNQPSRETRVFEVGKAAEVQRLLPLIEQLYKDQGDPAGGLADAQFLADGRLGQIIVSARAADLPRIEQIIHQLRGNEPREPARETRSFDLGSPEAVERLLPLVQQLYQDQWKDRADKDPADAQILGDTSQGRLIATGRPAHLEQVGHIVAQLTQDNAKVTAPQTRVFQLKTSSASELATTVRALYEEQRKGRLAGPVPLILPDAAANRLVVSGSSNEVAMVEELVRTLDDATVHGGNTRAFTLKNAAAQDVASVLSAAFIQYDGSGRSVPRLSAAPEAKSNTVLISGEPKDLQAAAVIIEQLDTAPTPRPRGIRIVALTNGLASQVATQINQLYQDQLKGQPVEQAPDAMILGDDVSNRLILTGSDAQLEMIEAIVSQLQEGPAGAGRQLRILPMHHNSAAAVSAVISQLFTRQVGSSDPAQRLVVTASPDDRTLLIDAAGVTLGQVEQLIKSLDTVDGNGGKVIQTVHLEQADPEDVAEAVNRTLQGRPGSVQRVRVTPVSGAGSLLLDGPGEALQEVLQIIKDLDSRSNGQEIKVRIYKLENGNAREVSNILEQILQTQRRRSRGRGSVPPPNIARDDPGNRLIVSGTDAAFQLIDQVLPLLDRAPDRADRDVEFVWLQHAEANDVVRKVEGLFLDRPRSERPVIEADAFSNSVTLIGRRADLAQAQDIIRRLDQTAVDTSLRVRLLPISGLPAQQMAAMLRNIYPQMYRTAVRVVDQLPAAPDQPAPAVQPSPDSPPPATNTTTNPPQAQAEKRIPEVVVAVDKEANALLLSGPSHELDQIERLVTELTFTFISTDAEFRQFPLKEADPVVVARTLTDLFKTEPVRVQEGNQSKVVVPPPKITVVPEPRTRSVIIRARPSDFVLLESLIQQLDLEGVSSQLSFRLIPVEHVRPDKLLPLVNQMVSQLSIIRPGEPLTITADNRSRGVLVVARDNIIERVKKLVESLDTAPGVGEAEVLIIPLKKANAAQLAAVLQAMLRPNGQGEATPDALELQEQVRRLKIQNDQGQAVLLDLSKPIKVSADSPGGNRLILTSTSDNLKAMAAVVDMMDSVAMIEGVTVRLVTLKHADASTVSQTLNTIFQQGLRLAAGPGGAGQPEGAAGKALVNPLNVAVDARSNSLILSGQAESIELAGRIIGDLDQELERFVTEVKLFRLKHASATRLAPLLQSVFSEGSPVPGSEGLSTQVTRLRAVLEGGTKNSEQPKTRSALTVQADDASNILIVAARNDMMPLVEAVLNGLDIPSASGMDGIRIYPLQHADAATLLQVLNDLYSTAKVPYLRAEDRPNITLDERTNALIVSGNMKAFAFIESLIAQLDRDLPFDVRDIRIIPLEKADAIAVAASLQRLLDARLSQKATQSRGADRLKAVVIGDPRLNSLLVAGSQESFELIQNLAKQLDKAGPGLAGGIRLIPLRYADARTLSVSLGALFNQRYQNVSSPELARNRPIIIPDPRSNSLLVAAGLEDNQSLDKLLEQLDQQPPVPATAITVIPLRHHDATTVAGTIQTLFAERLQARTPPGEPPPPQDRVTVQADPINNALVVSASQENLNLIQGLLEKLDVEPSAEGGLVQAFPLKYADAQRVATMLRSLVDQGLYRPGTGAGARQPQRDALAVTVDPASNTLIVSASPANLLLIQELIQKIDSKDYALEGNIRLFTLKYVPASHLATLLDQFFKAKRAGETGGPTPGPRSLPVSIIPDDRTQTLLVAGGKESFEAIDRMIAQLDVPNILGQANFRVFALTNATATKLQDTLTKLFTRRPARVPGEPADPINVIADAWANVLIVSANREDLLMVAALIDTLDSQRSDSESEVEIYPLAKADARRVAETIKGLFRDGAPGTGSPVVVDVDERLNAIVVSAGQTDRQRISELIRKLDTEEVSKVSEIKVFPLQYARAQSLSAILTLALNTKAESFSEQSPNTQSLLQFVTRTKEGQELVTSALRERVLITPDARMNSLIVSAPLDFMQLLEPIITRLDAESPQVAKIKVFTLKNADVRQMSEILTELFRLQRTATSAQPGGERSVQYTLVRPKIGAEGGVEEEIAASAVLGTAEESALTVTVDPRTNSLLVGGTEHYVTLAGQLIETLDSSPVQERVTQVYRLKNANAIEVQTALRSFLDQDRQRVISALGPEAVGTAQRILEREVAIVAEPISNTLLLSANPRYFTQVGELIKELDQPMPQVLIQVILAEVLLDKTRELGVEWNYNPRVDGRTIFTGTDFGVAGDLAALGGFSSAVTGNDYSFLLRALESEGRVEILSRPQILTADNQPATINIGQRVPLVTDSRVTERGDTITSFEYQNVGVSLGVTARISPDGFVKMDVGTTNSALTSENVDISQGVQVPIINERRATTTVSVQSGQSIIIGGLISSTDDTRKKKVPFLGDIPLLGVLFRGSRNFQDRKELLIIMTPQVLVKRNSESPMIPGSTDAESVTRQQLDHSDLRKNVKRDELQKAILGPLYPLKIEDPNAREEYRD